MDECLGPAPCHCSPPEGAITKEGVLHYKTGTSYLGKEHWKTCFVVLRWEPPQLWPQGWAVWPPAESSLQQVPEEKAQGGGAPPPTGLWGDITRDIRTYL